jgi:hypothetical protein
VEKEDEGGSEGDGWWLEVGGNKGTEKEGEKLVENHESFSRIATTLEKLASPVPSQDSTVFPRIRAAQRMFRKC